MDPDAYQNAIAKTLALMKGSSSPKPSITKKPQKLTLKPVTKKKAEQAPKESEKASDAEVAAALSGGLETVSIHQANF